ncbi:7599_t:CDS:2, partial [Cetraspora pellucida]
NSFFTSLQLQNNEQYLKDITYEIESRIDKSIILILKNNEFWNHLRIIIHILRPYLLTFITLESQHATLADAIYNPILLVCWSLHPKYVLAEAIHPELATIIKKEASILFEHLFPDKEIIKFQMQLIDWNNKVYPFDFESNWDNYLVNDLVYFWNNFQKEVSELSIFAACIMSMPPTSADCERFWSVMSNIHTLQHNRLINEQASKLSCIRWHIIQDKNTQKKNFQFNNENEFFNFENDSDNEFTLEE